MNSPLPEVDYAFLEDFLVRLLNTPSPTGFTEQAIALVQGALEALPGLSLRRTRKGALLATLPGPEAEPVRALTAHVDTLGAVPLRFASGIINTGAIIGMRLSKKVVIRPVQN